ncbi:MAG: hypothetical protein GW928_03600 [Rhodoferax sp.]|nr:hypothetical protein [Betaproteobacteria bacterium]NCN96550.1 hypothetical protein [Rhodoferax sp.]OIP21625.1 MAG: hypothetical protein AUK50_00935 [Comamonadaceae bacterium CG2_30_57_122]PIZ23458.1 MAG: hypothetical protein COY49_03200 [Comamonadaceae bacterium CG_4_10_14_0_8_um_filter_57_29]PJC14410.1 MAG: hypothetical protein CO065_14430 [Comamonadaceae bacterium CG_4_9_14_0_8_um_filter_57_21]
MKLKRIVWAGVGVFALSGSVLAQEPIYRCGNEYTNTVSQAKAKGCKLVEGGNLTVVQGARPKATAPKTTAPKAASTANVNPGSTRVDANAQKSRDSDARLILQSELTKAEARQAELLKEFNNGEPDKRGDEARNYQKYLDRVAELKASLARNESDIAGIQRELGRVSATTGR